LNSSPAFVDCEVFANNTTGQSGGYGGGGVYCDASPATFTDCSISGNEATRDGGGLYCRNKSDVSLTGCTLNGNESTNGGGLYAIGCGPVLTRCTIELNEVWGQGAGLYCGQNTVIDQCVVRLNGAFYHGVVEGGGMFCFDSTIVQECVVSDNEAGDEGGGAYCYHSVRLLRCVFESNRTFSSGAGGGAFVSGSVVVDGCRFVGNQSDYLGGGIGAVSNASVVNCVIEGNTAGQGAGMWCEGTASVRNCLVIGNVASSSSASPIAKGGGISCEGDNSVEFCTVAMNEAERGGGIHCQDGMGLGPGLLSIRHCILRGNTAALGPQAMVDYFHDRSATASMGRCSLQGGLAGVYVAGGSLLVDAGHNMSSNPLFASGALHDYYLSQTASGQASTSPCVDAGGGDAAALGFGSLTTRTDGAGDTGVVDLGYHAPYALWINSLTRQGQDVIIRWNGRSGADYVLEWSQDLVSWDHAYIGVSSSAIHFRAATRPRLIYRVRED